jgi:malonate-semialdehyde dehydrogenase (acetylating) / methylmalonate-semialdehyde dehydrogenase
MAILEEPLKGELHLQNYIDGEWVDSVGETQPIVNPATMRTLGYVPNSTAGEMAAAVAAAQAAFPEWRRPPPLARARCLFRLKELLEGSFEELSRIQTMEHGKTIDESRGETRRGIEMVEVATGIPSLMMGSNLEDVAAGLDETLIRQPLGVFGIIAPFNFPFMVPLWFAPFAVATGNCVVVKPSPKAPISQTHIAELAEEAGIPEGVWSVVHGDGEAASALVEHPDVKGVCFVGSTPVGREIYRQCGATGKRVIAQCGAKNFAVVMPDADVARTVASLMTSFFGNTGQRCLANANLVVVGEGLSAAEHDALYRRVVDAFVDMASRITLGYGLDEAVQMGPIKDPSSKDRVLGYIEKGVEEGATLRLDGRTFELVSNDLPRDCFIGPTVFEDVTPEMTLAQDEIFGPVAAMMKARSFDAALAMIDANPYGNAASIFTHSGRWAREFRYRVGCGNIGINVGIAAPMAFFPFSGMKDSFFGVLHGQGQEAVRFFTESKVVIERWF